MMATGTAASTDPMETVIPWLLLLVSVAAIVWLLARHGSGPSSSCECKQFLRTGKSTLECLDCHIVYEVRGLPKLATVEFPYRERKWSDPG